MRPGGGKAKGAQFEREVCVALSEWVTHGQREDCFWRSAMSGGRATIKKGSVRQAGDVCAVSWEGRAFCEYFYTECKRVHDLSIPGFILNGTGPLANFWKIARKEARDHKLSPLLIACENRMSPIVLSKHLWPIRRIAAWHSPGKPPVWYLYQLADLLASPPGPFGIPEKGERRKSSRERLD